MQGNAGWLRVCVFASALAWAGSADARSPDELDEDSQELLDRVQSLDSRTLQLGATGLRERGFVDQLADGEVSYILGVYEGAATVLSALVEDRSAFLHAGYARALYLLGDSLERLGDAGLARLYFERLFELDSDEYAMYGGLRLVEIALEYRDYRGAMDAFERVFARYGDIAGTTMSYVRGKIDFESGLFASSIPHFEEVMPGDVYYARARYYIGVVAVKARDFPEAMSVFGGLAAELEAYESISEEDQTVLELSHLAKARIHYELEEWDNAVISYAQVSPRSAQFDSALYEMSWTLIREERFLDAAFNLEVLASMSDNTQFVAEAQLLAGETFRKSETYDDAERFFRKTGVDFAGVWRELGTLFESDLSVSEIYQGIQDIDTGRIDSELRLEDWVVEDPAVVRALNYVRDSARVHRWVGESEAMIEEITGHLDTETGGALFSAASSFRSSLAAGWRESVQLRVDVLEEQQRAVSTRLTNAQQSDLDSVREEREALFETFVNTELVVPIHEPAEGGASSEEAARLNRMISDLTVSESAIERDLRELEALQVQLVENFSRGQVTPDESVQLGQELDATREELLAQASATRARRVELLELRGDDPSLMGGNESMRLLAELISVMDSEFALLAQSVDHDRYLAQLQSVISRLDSVDSQLRSLRDDLGRAIARRRSVYRDMVALERRRVESMNATLADYDEAGAALTDRVARESMMVMHEKIADVVLRANLGTIDVSWWQKEHLREEIEDLQLDLRREITTLDADFAEILGE